MTDELTRDTLPSERGELQKAITKEMEDKAKLREQLLREDLGKVFRTEHGKRVLALIMERSGFGKPILSATAEHGIDKDLTTFAAMELNFYLFLRSHIPVSVLHEVEYGLVKPSGTVDDEALRKSSKSKRKKK